MLVTLRVIGMSCNGCVRHVDKALREVPGVSAVEVSLPLASANVTHDGSVDLAALGAAVESAGYKLDGHAHADSRL